MTAVRMKWAISNTSTDWLDYYGRALKGKVAALLTQLYIRSEGF